MDGSADAISVDVAHAQALGHQTLTGERRVTMDEDRQRRERTRRIDLVLSRAHHAQHQRVDRFEVAGVGGELDLDLVAGRAVMVTRRTQVVLHVARTLHGRRIDVALEFLEDVLQALAHHVGQDVQTTAVRHAHHRRIQTGVRRAREDLVHDRNGALGTLETEPLGAHVLGGEELLERLGGVEAFEHAVLLVLGQLERHTLEMRLDPTLLVGVLNVHVLHADGAAIRVAQHAEKVTQAHLGGAGHATGEELSIEIPDGQSVGDGVQFHRELGLLPAQRIDVGDEVSADPVHADERGDLHLLVQHRLLAVHRVDVDAPLHRFVRDTEAAEHRLVEAVLTQQQFVHPLQEQTALGTLNDAVVVGGRDGDDLGDTQRGQRTLVGALELGRIIDGTDAHDDALSGHQTRDTLHGADGSRIREADGRTLEVRDLQLVLLDLAHQILVGHHEVGERHCVGVTQNRHDQIATSVGLGHVHRQTHADVSVTHDARFTVGPLEIGVVHLRNRVGDRPHDRVSDDVRETHLALTGATAVAVDDRAVHLEQLGRNVAEAGGGRNAKAAFHVGHDRHAGALDGFARVGGRNRSGRLRGCGSRGRRRSVRGRRGRDRGCRRRRSGTGREGLVIREELLPGLADRGRVEAELLVHLLHEPGVGPEVGLSVSRGIQRFGHGETVPLPMHSPAVLCPANHGRVTARTINGLIFASIHL